MKKLFLLGIISIIVLSLAACEDVTPKKVDNSVKSTTETTVSSNEQTKKAETFKIGDSIEAGKALFTVNGVRESQGTDFEKPKEGNTYYLVDVTVENKGTESYNVSSLMMFKLMDSEAFSHAVSIFTGGKGQVDGEIAAGRKLRGELCFEIPKVTKGLELEIDPTLLGSGKVIVKLDR